MYKLLLYYNDFNIKGVNSDNATQNTEEFKGSLKIVYSLKFNFYN